MKGAAAANGKGSGLLRDLNSSLDLTWKVTCPHGPRLPMLPRCQALCWECIHFTHQPVQHEADYCSYLKEVGRICESEERIRRPHLRQRMEEATGFQARGWLLQHQSFNSVPSFQQKELMTCLSLVYFIWKQWKRGRTWAFQTSSLEKHPVAFAFLFCWI